MVNVCSIYELLAARLRAASPRAAIVNAIPLLLAALLVGCASTAQHRSANAQVALGKSASPPPVQASAGEEEKSPSPPVFRDDGGQTPEEGVVSPERFRDDTTDAAPEVPAAAQRFEDETGPVTEDKAFAQQPFADDTARPDSDDAPVQQAFVDDSAAAGEESIVAPQHFDDDAPTTVDEGIVHQPFSDDTDSAKDEAVAQQRFTDDSGAGGDEATPPTEVYSDEGGQAREEPVREPEVFTDDGNVAAADDGKTPSATVLPLTVTVEADPLFDFDQYAIRAESRSKLDDLIRQLQGTAYGEVRTVGFADPIGSAFYNQSLSERRAASVKQYLTSKGIPANRIVIEGRGATEEFAAYKNCTGEGRDKLITCLQPDRRVEVTVTAGTQQ